MLTSLNYDDTQVGGGYLVLDFSSVAVKDENLDETFVYFIDFLMVISCQTLPGLWISLSVMMMVFLFCGCCVIVGIFTYFHIKVKRTLHRLTRVKKTTQNLPYH